ncbi:MAG: ABC transporter permease [Lachnospiraceae bacterium]|nr:ABC transporter permease [Lachnospiraceae bacterium]
MKVKELSNSLIGTRASGAQTGASLKVRELSNALIDTRVVGAQTGISMKTHAVGEQIGAKMNRSSYKAIFTLVKRNFLLYSRDRAQVLFSILTMLIVIVLTVLFLGKSTYDSLEEILVGFGKTITEETTENMKSVLFLWNIAGILVVNSVTISLTMAGRIVIDQETNKQMSLRVTPLKQWQLAVSYILSSVVVSTVMCLITYGIALGINTLQGGDFPSLTTHGKVCGLILLNCILYSTFMQIIALCVKSAGAWTGFGTIVGTLIGFLGAIYLPMGMLTDSVRLFLKCLPVLHQSALLRDLLTNAPIQTLFKGLDPLVLEEYRKAMGIQINWGEHILPTIVSVAFLFICAMLSLIGALRIRSK